MSPVARHLVGLVWGLAAGSAFAGSETEVEAIALNCVTCHTNAPSSEMAVIPDLQRSKRSDLRQALLAFKYGQRPATLMPRLVKGYRDDELAAVADYLGSD